MDQKSLVLVKPDGVRKNLIGEIIARFERRGLKICALSPFSRNWKHLLPAALWLLWWLKDKMPLRLFAR